MRSTWLKKWLGGVAAGALALLATASAVHAQTSTGNVRGYVRGEGDVPLSDVTVAARSVDVGGTRGASTNEAGFYNLAGLRPGRYTIEARRIGFSPQSRDIVVQIGQNLTLDFS